MLGVVYLIFAAVALVAGLYHLFYWNYVYDNFEALRMPATSFAIDPDYLSIRSEFWGALLIGLCLCLAFEGIYKMRRASAHSQTV